MRIHPEKSRNQTWGSILVLWGPQIITSWGLKELFQFHVKPPQSQETTLCDLEQVSCPLYCPIFPSLQGGIGAGHLGPPSILTFWGLQ